MSLFSDYVYTPIIEPALQSVLGNKADAAFSGLSQEIRARFLAGLGQPGNHDIERAVRVAQLQSLELLLSNYLRFLKTMEIAGEGVDLEHFPEQFVEDCKEFIARAFRRRVSVELNGRLFAKARDAIGESLLYGSGYLGNQNGNQAGETLASFVLEEIREQTFRAPPPSFLDWFRDGSGEAPSWLAGFRAFLCEQVKSNPRFSAILSASVLEAIQTKQTELQIDAAAHQVALAKAIEANSTEILKGFGELGRRLAILETLADQNGLPRDAHLVHLLESVSARIPEGLQDALDGNLHHVGNRAYLQSVARTKEFASRSLFGRSNDLEGLDAFIFGNNSGICIVAAEAGVGKSHFLDAWSDAIAAPQVLVLKHFISNRYQETTSHSGLLRSLTRQVFLHCGPRALGTGIVSDNEDLADRLSFFLSCDQPIGMRLIVVIDSLDEAREFLRPFFDGALGRGVFVVVSARASKGTCPAFLQPWLELGSFGGAFKLINMPPLTKSSVAGWLESITGRVASVPGRELEAMWDATEGIPLFISYVVPTILSEVDGKRRHGGMVGVTSFRDFAKKELDLLTRLLAGPNSRGEQWLLELFALLTITKAPLSFSDVHRILRNQIRVDALAPAVSRWFAINESDDARTIAFAHPRLAEVFRAIIPVEEIEHVGALLLDYIQHAWKEHDGARPSLYSIEWAVEHLIEFHSVEAASQLITSKSFIEKRLNAPQAEINIVRIISETGKLINLRPDDELLARWNIFWACFETSTRIIYTYGIDFAVAPNKLFQSLLVDVDHESASAPETGHENAEKNTLGFVLSAAVPPRDSRLVRMIGDAHPGPISGMIQLDNRLVSWGMGGVSFWSLEGDPLPGGITGLESWTTDLEIFRDGLISWGDDGAVRLWSRDGELSSAACLKAHEGMTSVLPHESGFVSWGFDDCFIRSWSYQGELLWEFEAENGGVREVIVVKNGFIACGQDGSIVILSLTGEEIARRENAHQGYISNLLLGSDCIVTCGEDGFIRFWSANNLEMLHEHPQLHSEWSREVIRLADRFVSLGTSEVRFWSLVGEALDGGRDEELWHGAGTLVKVRDRIITLSHSGAMDLWTIDGQHLSTRLPSSRWSDDAISSIWVCGDTLVTTNKITHALRTWSISGDVFTAEDTISSVMRGATSGSLLLPNYYLTWEARGAIKFWSRSTCVDDLDRDFGPICEISALDNRLLCQTETGNLLLWSPVSMDPLHAVTPAHLGGIERAIVLDDKILTCGKDGAIRFWSRDNLDGLGEIQNAHNGPVTSILVADDRIMSYGEDGALLFWSFSGVALSGGDRNAHPGGVRRVYRSEEPALISYGWDGSLKFWSGLGERRVGGSDNAHPGGVCGLLFTEKRIVSFGLDGSFCLWTYEGQQVPGGEVHLHNKPIIRMFEIDGRLLSSSTDRRFCLWTLDGEFVCHDQFGQDECDRLLPLNPNFMTTRYDGSICVWDRNGNLISEAAGNAAYINDVLVLEDRFITAGSNGSLCFWDSCGAPIQGGNTRAHASEISEIIQLGDRIVTIGGNMVRLWSIDGVALTSWVAPGTIEYVRPVTNDQLAICINGVPRTLSIVYN